MPKTFDYQKWTIIGFWNVGTLPDNRSEAPQNARFLQLEREFQRYKFDMGLNEVTLEDTPFNFAAMCFSTLESEVAAVMNCDPGERASQLYSIMHQRKLPI